ALIIYTMPIWALLIGVAIYREHLTRWRTIGIIISTVALMTYVSRDPAIHLAGHNAWGACLLLIAAIAWAIGACLYRGRGQWVTDRWAQLAFQHAVSAVALVPLAWTHESLCDIKWTRSVWIALGYNWFAGSGLAPWLWFRVLTHYPAALAGQF